MKRLIASATGLVAALVAGPALAAFTAVTSQDVDNLIGVSTSGSETGLYELVASQTVILGVLFGMVIAGVAYAYIKKYVMKARAT